MRFAEKRGRRVFRAPKRNTCGRRLTRRRILEACTEPDRRGGAHEEGRGGSGLRAEYTVSAVTTAVKSGRSRNGQGEQACSGVRELTAPRKYST